MPKLSHGRAARRFVGALIITGLASVAAVSMGVTAQERRTIAIADTHVFPESLTSSSDGTVWIGSSAKGTIYRAAPNASRAEPWIPAGTAGLQRVFGVLADERSRTLWVCAAPVPAAGDAAAVPTTIKAFDLVSAALKQSYGFAGGGSCNDMAVAFDGSVYATDFPGGRVLRLRPGSSEFEAWAADAQLATADGIAVLDDGAVYVNTFKSGLLFKIPVGATGAAGAVIPIATSRPLARPDGMRAVGPQTILLAEGEGRLVELTVRDSRADVRVLRDGFTEGPVAVTLAGNAAYVIEAKFRFRSDPSLRSQDPGPFEAIAVPYPSAVGEGQATGGVDPRPPNGAGQTPAFAGQTRAPERKANVAFEVVTVAAGLQNPWSLAFLPDGRMLVTERPGRLRIVARDGTLSEPVAGLPAVDARAQGGLLDVVLDPRFADSRLIYWGYAEPRGDGVNNTAVARGTLVDGPAPRVENVQVIFHQLPSLNSALHFGNRLVFARDGTIYITLGERSTIEGRMQAQRKDGLLGKVVRLNADGSIPTDNPFVGVAGVRPEIWSLGHRNIQAAALHPVTGELWEVEHGTRGGDEINVARKGKDYGWPTIAYGIEYRGAPISGGITAQDGMEQPIYYWDPVIGPSGMAFYTADLFPAWKGSVFIGGHATNDLVRLTLDGEKIVGEERLLKDLQPRPERIRDVRQGPDGALYVLTDNAQGRLLKLVPPTR